MYELSDGISLSFDLRFLILDFFFLCLEDGSKLGFLSSFETHRVLFF